MNDEVAKPAHLYRHFDKDNRLLYIGVSKSAIFRLSQHQDHSHWFNLITYITIEKFSDRKIALKAEQQAISKENPLFNLLRPSVKEEEALDRPNESKKELVHRLVQFNALYSTKDAAKALLLGHQKIKEMISNNEIGFITRKRHPRKNNKGELTAYPEHLITGWQLIDYIEYISPSKTKC